MVERRSETIDGWRVWNLGFREGLPALLPAGSGVDDPWPLRRAARARCGTSSLLRGTRRPHDAPDPACTCGIYARRSLDLSPRVAPAYPVPPVVGTVSLWGRVIEHELGWRGALAYPARLTIACTLCLSLEPGPGEPAVIHRFLGQLYPMCSVHRKGLELPGGRRTALTDLEPDALRRDLLDAYGVDLLPFEPVAELCSRPPAEPPPAYVPVIRVI